MSYDRQAIHRALQFHRAHAHPAEYRYHGYDPESDRYRITLMGELMALRPREAWIVSYALAAGRITGKLAADAAAAERGG